MIESPIIRVMGDGGGRTRDAEKERGEMERENKKGREGYRKRGREVEREMQRKRGGRWRERIRREEKESGTSPT